MSFRFHPRLGVPALAAGGAALGLVLGLQPPMARAAEFERSFTFQAHEITVTSLVGSVRVEKAAGNEVQVKVAVRGADADPKWITFDQDTGSRAQLTVGFPIRDHRRYVYPKLGAGRSNFTITRDHHDGDDDWFNKLLDFATGDRIEVRGHSFSDALELWADVVVQVPDGCRATLQLGIGDMSAADVAADLRLKVKSGEVTAKGIKGDLLVDTGSGRVDVEGVTGEVDVDTGSGEVTVADVTGARRVKIDTGSGGVEVENIAADELSLDTGSGGIDVSNVQVKDLAVDTGSGGVDAERVAADDVKIDTGSGAVTLALTRMGRGHFDIDTGSGGIRLDMPHEINADFHVESSSGGIIADIDGVTLDRHERHAARFTVGGGDARVTLSAGSGSIRLTQGRGGSASR